jgi:hypothetical protein
MMKKITLNCISEHFINAFTVTNKNDDRALYYKIFKKIDFIADKTCMILFLLSKIFYNS